MPFPRREEEGAILPIVEMRNPHGTPAGNTIVILVERLARDAQGVIVPLVTIQILVAEIEEGSAMMGVGAALRFHRDEAARIAAFVGCEYAALYAKYKAMAEALPDVHFAGRLATYKYYNMDQVVAQALTLSEKLSGRRSTHTSSKGVVALPASIRNGDEKTSALQQEDTEAA